MLCAFHALAAVLQELDLQAVVGEALDVDRAQRNVEISAHLVSEALTPGTREDAYLGHGWKSTERRADVPSSKTASCGW